MSDIPKCMLCGGRSFVQTPYFYDFKSKVIHIVRCRTCGLGTLSPMVSESDIVSLYSTSYFEKDYHCGVSRGTYAEEVENTRREFRPLLSLVRKYKPAGGFLEIGCAGGATLAEARAQGFETVGVELSSEMAEWGRQHLHLDIRDGMLHEQNFTDQSFDVVFLGDVIEHLLKPRELLGEVHRILRPNGVIALAYPMELNHIVPRVRMLTNRKKQSPNKPYHLFYYNPSVLARLLHESGFDVEVTQVHKMVRKSPIPVRLLDSFNYVVTRASGLFGDRGFTIARKK